MGVSSRAMLSALIAGERDPAVLAEPAKGRLRVKNPALIEALTGRFDEHHGELADILLGQIDPSPPRSSGSTPGPSRSSPTFPPPKLDRLLRPPRPVTGRRRPTWPQSNASTKSLASVATAPRRSSPRSACRWRYSQPVPTWCHGPRSHPA